VTTTSEERVRTFLREMASESPSADTETPGRVKRQSRLRMLGWALATGLAVVGVPIAALVALRAMPDERQHQPAAPATQAQLAFERDGRLWLMAPDGSEQQPLTPADVYAIEPDWSPDGTRVVFIADNRISVIDVDTGELQTLPATPGGQPIGPQWAPDGQSIAFVDALASGDGSGIYVLSLGDESIEVVTEEGSGDLITWSPDGSEIAFTRDKSDEANIWAVDVTTHELRQIGDSGFEYDPAWSPDGSTIAYFGGQIWIVNADGSGQPRQVTDCSCEAFNPHWSPDGSWIVFYSDQNSGHDDLYRIHPDGTGLERLTDTPVVEKGGDWQPPA
jgi:Tol biopolymer transport system component